MFRSSNLKCKIRTVLLITTLFVKIENLKYFENLKFLRVFFKISRFFNFLRFLKKLRFLKINIFLFLIFIRDSCIPFTFYCTCLLLLLFYSYSLIFFLVHSALRAPPAVTRLTIHRRFQVSVELHS